MSQAVKLEDIPPWQKRLKPLRPRRHVVSASIHLSIPGQSIYVQLTKVAQAGAFQSKWLLDDQTICHADQMPALKSLSKPSVPLFPVIPVDSGGPKGTLSDMMDSSRLSIEPCVKNCHNCDLEPRPLLRTTYQAPAPLSNFCGDTPLSPGLGEAEVRLQDLTVAPL